MGTDAEGEKVKREKLISIFNQLNVKVKDHMKNIVPILLDQNVTINDKIR